MRRLYELPNDKNGEKAFLGNFSKRMFDYLQKIDTGAEDEQLKLSGGEGYNKDFVIKLLKWALKRRIPEPDLILTATKYIAFTIWQASDRFQSHKLDTICLGGAGSHNRYLVKSLSEYFENKKIKEIAEYGINENFNEALSSAILANELVRGNQNNLPGDINTQIPALLGKICPA